MVHVQAGAHKCRKAAPRSIQQRTIAWNSDVLTTAARLWPRRRFAALMGSWYKQGRCTMVVIHAYVFVQNKVENDCSVCKFTDAV